MKDNILSINLETQTAPVVSEVRGKDYIEYGTEDWKNLYPQFLIDLYYNSSTHAAIVNSTAEMIAGEDLIVEDDDTNLDAYVKLKKFLRHANSKESLHQVVKKISFDFLPILFFTIFKFSAILFFLSLEPGPQFKLL